MFDACCVVQYLELTAGVNWNVGCIAVLEVGTGAERHSGRDATLLDLNGACLRPEEEGGGDGESSEGLHGDGM